MSPFEHHFQRRVQPKLRRRITAVARRVAAGELGFEAAQAEIMRLALANGAAWLSETTFAHLEDWVDADLADAIDERL